MNKRQSPAARQLFAIVLAAGAASRFGASKQLAEYGGEPLVRRTVRLAEAICGANSLLVTGSDGQNVLSAAAPLAGFLVHNEAFAAGMSGSIACGIRAVAEIADAVLILLADQPLITEDHLLDLRCAWSEEPQRIVATAYAEIVGAPAVLPRRVFGELLSLEGDQGARAVIMHHRRTVVTIPFEPGAVDIDTPADLARLD